MLSLPPQLSPTVRILDLSYNEIEEGPDVIAVLNNIDFENSLQSLEEIDLSGNPIDLSDNPMSWLDKHNIKNKLGHWMKFQRDIADFFKKYVLH